MKHRFTKFICDECGKDHTVGYCKNVADDIVYPSGWFTHHQYYLKPGGVGIEPDKLFCSMSCLEKGIATWEQLVALWKNK